MLFTTPWLP